MSTFTLADIGVQGWRWSVVPHDTLPRAVVLACAVPTPDGVLEFGCPITHAFLNGAGWPGAARAVEMVVSAAASRTMRYYGYRSDWLSADAGGAA